jgi:DNA-binding CsgD family transcriptional regulator/tetratricopeptide (TPR) repeat protein
VEHEGNQPPALALSPRGPAPERSASGTTLYGREAECARIEALLDGARTSRSGRLLIRGDAGVGKSALLDASARRARDMGVLTTRGIESEARLQFAALHQLLLPLLEHVDTLPAPQARALRAAFGLEEPASDSRFLVSAAVLSLLAQAAQARPLLCLVDDVQWLDRATADALLFVAGRLGSEGVVILFAARDDGAADFEGLPQLTLGGLDPHAASELLERHAGGPLAAEVRERLLEATAGNPLALLEFAAALTEGQRSGAEPLLDPLPVGSRVARAFLARVRRLPQPTQTLLLVASADDSGDLSTVLAAAAHLGIGCGALDPAEEAGLARTDASRLRLRHPLLRSVIYHGATLSQRRAAHGALAGALAGDEHADRRAWHSAAASIEPDPAVVEELERAAHRARGRGGFAAASLALERAASLASQDDERARHLTWAAKDAWLAGLLDRARGLTERARPLSDDDPLLRSHVLDVRGLIELSRGEPAQACGLLARAATDVAPFDEERALELLAVACWAASYAPNAEAIAAAAKLAEEHAGGDTPIARLLASALVGVRAHHAGDFAVAVPAFRAVLAGADDAKTADDPHLLFVVGASGVLVGDDRAAHDLHRRALSLVRETAARSLLADALGRLAYSDICAGRWSSAAASLREGLELASRIGQPNIAARLLALLAVTASLQGDEDECRTLVTESLRLAGAGDLTPVRSLATWALVALEVGLGRGADALARLRSTTTHAPYCDALERVEAAVRAGEPDAARAFLDEFERWADSCAAPWARAVAAHGRALLAQDIADATRHFEAALELHERAHRPFERARTELAFGELLRRARRRAESRAHLRSARAAFEQLGARLWAERARAELRASGQTARARDPSTLDQLTPQELQISSFVAAGATNRDIAAQLFLSPRTIDFHLRNVFRKLGISSRVELARIDLDAAAPPAMAA